MLYVLQGNTIQGHMERHFIYKLDKDIQEGYVYYISKFTVAPNSGDYRPARHSYMLTSYWLLRFALLQQKQSPYLPYRFTAPEECFDLGLTKTIFIVN